MITFIRRKDLAAYVVMAALLSTAASCPQTQNRTPEGLIAEYGVKIAKTVGAAQEAVGAVGKASTLQPVREASLKALEGLQVVNQKGLQLADVLDAINKARAIGTVDGNLLTQALALVDGIDTELLTRVVPQLGSPEARAALDAVRAIGKLILSIQLELGKAQVQTS